MPYNSPSPPQKILLVCATRAKTLEDFYQNTLLGQCLKLQRTVHQAYTETFIVKAFIVVNNTDHLTTVYNHAIEQFHTQYDVIIFLHDDVNLLNYYWAFSVTDGLQHFDILGIAGAKTIYPNQFHWCLTYEQESYGQGWKWLPFSELSGAVCSPVNQTDNLCFYNLPRQEVKLIDGVFIACNTQIFKNPQIRFDEQFSFHFYDLDFCRTASAQNFKIGVWDIAIFHQSIGLSASSISIHRENLSKYKEKWSQYTPKKSFSLRANISK